MQASGLTVRVAKTGNKMASAAAKKTQVDKSIPKRRLRPCAMPRICWIQFTSYDHNKGSQVV